MKTFIYQDEKSHKFWAIEQQGHELHLRWGKVGTHGQSQIKTFADAAAASKAEVKLINEKPAKATLKLLAPSSLPYPHRHQPPHSPNTPQRPQTSPVRGWRTMANCFYRMSCLKRCSLLASFPVNRSPRLKIAN